MLNIYKFYDTPEELPLNQLSTAIDKLRNKNDWGVTVWYSDLKDIEHIIRKNPSLAGDYAQFILGKRWPEAEPIIMKDAKSAFYYADALIKGRWPEAEPYIMKDPYYAFLYATDIIKGRWVEAEPYIKKDNWNWIKYKQFLTMQGM